MVLPECAVTHVTDSRNVTGMFFSDFDQHASLLCPPNYVLDLAVQPKYALKCPMPRAKVITNSKWIV